MGLPLATRRCVRKRRAAQVPFDRLDAWAASPPHGARASKAVGSAGVRPPRASAWLLPRRSSAALVTESWESLAAYFNELGAAAGDVPQRPQRKTEIDKNWAVVIERTLGNVFAVAERALNARMTPDEDYRLRFWLNMLKLDGP